MGGVKLGKGLRPGTHSLVGKGNAANEVKTIGEIYPRKLKRSMPQILRAVVKLRQIGLKEREGGGWGGGKIGGRKEGG